MSLARMLPGELIARGIRVMTLPNQVPAGRFGKPSEFAKAVVYLASDESALTVGSELLIDGGVGNL